MGHYLGITGEFVETKLCMHSITCVPGTLLQINSQLRVKCGAIKIKLCEVGNYLKLIKLLSELMIRNSQGSSVCVYELEYVIIVII